jgi:hypothetical protein
VYRTYDTIASDPAEELPLSLTTRGSAAATAGEVGEEEASVGTRLMQSSLWYRLTAGYSSTPGRFSKATAHTKSLVEMDSVPWSVSRRNRTMD